MSMLHVMPAHINTTLFDEDHLTQFEVVYFPFCFFLSIVILDEVLSTHVLILSLYTLYKVYSYSTTIHP